MPLQNLKFRAGINRESTSYSNEGGWFNGDKIRFRDQYPEKIGGWARYSGNQFLGTCRSLYSWVALDGSIYLGVGTNSKFYVEQGETYYDITPLRKTTTNATTFAATNGSAIITVTDSGNGVSVGDFVTFSGAATLGGNVTAAILNAEHEVVSVPTGNTYTITVSVSANASDSGNGGGSVTSVYQINVGLNTGVTGTGWGIGTWGRGTWGSGSSSAGAEAQLGLWTQDNFGEDLLINQRQGNIYYWDASAGVSSRAVVLSGLSGANLAPTVAKQIMVSDRDRHVIAFGCDDESSIGTQDPLLIRFADQESLTDWQTRTDNTAGSLKLGTGSEIVCAKEAREEILVWTDVSLHSMRFLGPPFTFGISQISGLITIMSPNAAIAVEDFSAWMGRDDFYVYKGGVSTLPCTVKQYVFSDMNQDQTQKICCGVNSAFSEIWWFYPSSSSTENDRYVVWNYTNNLWYYGNLPRTAWLDRGIKSNPIGASDDKYLYSHELGLDDGSTVPASAISSFIESSQVDIGQGDQFSFVSRVIPDISFTTSTASSPSANLILKSRNFPGADYEQTDTSGVTQTASSPIELYTEKADVRLRGRSMTLRVESSSTGVQWKLGTPRMNVRPDGRR
jgi:hypothetical protein|tara:strand:- start:43427 stop:45286 length:1860 start_codon:yes stop_codon:yes gene_type:complete